MQCKVDSATRRMEMELNDVTNRFSDMLSQAGWEIVVGEEEILEISDKHTVYKKSFQDSYGYCIYCYAWISINRQGMYLDSHLGVLWIDAIHENALPYSYNVLTDMRTAIECAECDLLTMHVPFSDDYKFHGKDADERKRLNEQTRSSWELDEIELMLRNKKPPQVN